MKVTQKMVDTAENRHFNTETSASLDRHHALLYLRAKQTGDKKMARYMAGIPGVKKNAERLMRKKTNRRRKTPASNLMFKPIKIRSNLF